jgi:endonuclease III
VFLYQKYFIRIGRTNTYALINSTGERHGGSLSDPVLARSSRELRRKGAGQMSKIITTIGLIRKQVRTFTVPAVTSLSYRKDPYKVLISCLLSLRTKDKTTAQVSNALFKIAHSPQKMVQLPLLRLEKVIYPAGFYRNKARTLKQVSRRLLDDFKGKVPDTAEGLLSLKGVGRKTANLVLGLAFGKPAICVDTHVHRIPNRLGWVRTKDPFRTELALQKIVPKRFWIELNTLLVTFGQNICVPVFPLCTKCTVYTYCERVGVKQWR